MKKIPIFLLLSLVIAQIHAQSVKNDYAWLFGYDSNPNNLDYGGSRIDFFSDSIDIYYEYRDMNFDMTNASICNDEGELQFYTNGIYVANALNEIMENGEGLNPDPYTQEWEDYGYRLCQGSLILPLPGSSNIYYLIHEERTFANYDGHLTLIPHVLFTIVDMEKKQWLRDGNSKKSGYII